jgi:hypothetical protein
MREIRSTRLEALHLQGINIKSNDWESLLSDRIRQRQADIAKAAHAHDRLAMFDLVA